MYTNIIISNITKKLVVLCIVPLLVVILSTGCTENTQPIQQSVTDEFVEYEYEIIDENVNTKQISLYFPDRDYETLVRVVSKVRVYEGTNEISVIINKLLNTHITEETEHSLVFDGTIGLEWVTVSRNLATINLYGDFDTLDNLVLYSGIVSLVNTVCELGYIDYVEILANGKQIPNSGLLKTPMTKVNEKLKLSYLEHLDTIANATSVSLLKENTIFYYLDLKSNYLIADVSNVAIAKDNAAEDIFRLLKSGPNYDSGMRACIPQNILLVDSSIVNEEGVDGEISVLTIRLESHVYEDGTDSKSSYMICGGLTLTMLSYFSDVDAVRILINNEYAMEDRLLTRDDFTESVGHLVSLYMPNRDYSKLMEVQSAVSQDDYNNPSEIIDEILNYEIKYYSYTRGVFPVNATGEDILEVVVYNNSCVINMSESLMIRLKASKYEQQRSFVYAIVNTLTKLDNISNVQFIVDGKVNEKIGEYIYIQTPIIKNPGILLQ